MKKIGMLTSGGDCQALNPTMRGVAKGLENLFGDVEIYGFLDGYKGLIYGNYKKMEPMEFSGLLGKGGTILGTSRVPFKYLDTPTEDGIEKVPAMVKTYKKLDLDCLVVLGGNGSQKTAYRLSQEGLNVIGLPKTIDNDIYGTDMTFGFQSAVDVATHAIDCIYTTAESHSRIFVIETMGHKVGWITLYAGVAGGADVILLPEIPYDMKKVYKTIEKRRKMGKNFIIMVVAEGAISKELAKLPKKERKQKIAERTHPSIAYEIADILREKYQDTADVRVALPGHTQRGGNPDAYDRIISSRFGAKAAELIKAKDFGKLVVFRNNEVDAIPMEESAGKLKYVDPEDQLIKEAKTLGISFGD
jgi:6-phosphofructokinase 1